MLRGLLFRSLKSRIVAAAGALFLLGVGAITVLIAHFLHKDMKALLTANQLAAVTSIAGDIDGKLKLRIESLQRVAGNLPHGFLDQPRALQAWLDDRLAIQTMFPIGLMVIPPDGGPPLADTPRLATRPKSFGDRDWFIGATTTGKPYISKPLVARATGQPAMVIAIPIHGPGERLLGLLIGVTPLASDGFLDRILNTHPGEGGSYELISLRDHSYVMTSSGRETTQALPPDGSDPLLDRALAGARNILIDQGPDGVEELAAIAAIPQAGWLLISRQPSAQAFLAVTHAQHLAAVLAGGLALLFATLLLVLLARILRPLATLAEHLRSMASGERAMLPLPPMAGSEITEVINSFNLLQQRVQEQEKKLAGLAHHDTLTGLPNRLTVTDRLESELLRVRRSGTGLALLFLDLDGFKPVNDQYGHHTGDLLLIGIARRLEGCVRDIDTVARLGGDEFLLLISETEQPAEAAERVARQCVTVLASPFHIEGRSISIHASIGIVTASGEETARLTPSQLIQAADQAMYQAKTRGRACFVRIAPPPSIPEH